MKSFKEYVIEEDKKKRTQQKEKPSADWSSFDDFFNQRPDQLPSAPQQNQPEEPRADQHHEPEDPRQRRASQSDTHRATRNITPNDQMRDMLGRMRNIEADDDHEYPAPDEAENLPDVHVNQQNLPAIAGQQLQAAGIEDPTFHKVANLPGNMSRAIRTLGKSLFRSLTRTPTENIWMLGNLNNQGPNTRSEVNAVANWISENGHDVGNGNIDFDASIPGYDADIHQFSAGGIRWLMVRDQFGDYIYSWPESDSIDVAPAVGHNADRPRLGH
jgi:hypothetical protein